MALIKTTEEFQKHVRVNSDVDIDNLMADILLVEDTHIVKILGEGFYDQLSEKYESGTLSELEEKLLLHLQYAIAHIAQAEYMDLNQILISDAGIHITSDSTQKTAFQWQINNAVASLKKKGFNGLERALRFLEKNIDAPEFEAWATSPAVAEYRQYFIGSASEFNQFYNIGNSWLTYLAFLPIIRKVEDFNLLPVLGEDFCDELKEILKDREANPDTDYLLEKFIRPALAHLVIAKALNEQGFRLVDGEIQISLYRQKTDSKEYGPENAESLLEGKRQAALLDGTAYLVKLKTYLNANASETKYATYFASSLYVSPEASKPAYYTNPTDSKTFYFG